jgi:hypothetical protein
VTGKKTGKNRKRLSRWKRAAFALATPFMLLGIIEGTFRLLGVNYAVEELGRARGFSPQDSHFVEETDGSDRERIRTKQLSKALFKRPFLNAAAFDRKPGPGITRIMFLGGSTVYGWPYDGRLSFTAWLKAGLSSIQGKERFEILNFGVPGYGSRRVPNILDDALRFEPDMVFIFTGHNESLETQFSETVLNLPEKLLNTHLFLRNHLRFYAALDHLAGSVLGSDTSPEDGGDVAAPKVYNRQRALMLREAFRVNLMRIYGLCRKQNVHVVFATLPVNLKDVRPLNRYPLVHEQIRPRGIPAMIDRWPEEAALYYRYGQVLYGKGQFREAKVQFQAACDLDPCSLRASSALNGVLEEMGALDGAGLLRLSEAFERAAPEGIPGNDLFHDHVHPRFEGHRLIALEVARYLVKYGVLSPPDGWEVAFLERVDGARRETPLTRTDHYHYWQVMAVFHNLHGDREKVAECLRKMKAYENGERP